MNSEFFSSILEAFLQKGLFTTSSLLVIVIVISIYGYKYFIQPTHEKVKEIPSKKDMEAMLKEHVNVEELSDKLDEILSKLLEGNEIGRSSNRDVNEVKRDMEQIKQMLNQFQGHLMYGGGRRGGDFGNRELK